MLDPRILKINPKIVILQRNDIVFTTMLATGQGQLQLQLIDIILLLCFFNKKSEEDVINTFLNNVYVKFLAPSMNQQMVRQSIASFINAQVLIINTSHNDKSTQNKTVKRQSPIAIKVTNFDLKHEGIYKISRNFALVPGENGFKIWSGLINKYYELNIEETIITVVFLKGRTCESVMSDLSFIKQKEFQRSVCNLIQNNILILSISKTKFNIKERKLPDVASTYSSKYENWEQIDSDSRIPVYFVPHMENHFPLALGLLFTAIQNHNDGELLSRFNLIPITYFTPKNLLNVVYRKFGRGIWLFSNYMWSLDLNLEISRLVKDHDSLNLTIHGGPSTPNYRQASIDFMSENNSVDISVHGEGENYYF